MSFSNNSKFKTFYECQNKTFLLKKAFVKEYLVILANEKFSLYINDWIFPEIRKFIINRVRCIKNDIE